MLSEQCGQQGASRPRWELDLESAARFPQHVEDDCAAVFGTHDDTPESGRGHADCAADEMSESVGRVAGTHVGELLQTIESEILLHGFVSIHQFSWLTSIRNTGRPSPSTVIPARARNPANRAGTGFT